MKAEARYSPEKDAFVMGPKRQKIEHDSTEKLFRLEEFRTHFSSDRFSSRFIREIQRSENAEFMILLSASRRGFHGMKFDFLHTINSKEKFEKTPRESRNKKDYSHRYVMIYSCSYLEIDT